ncbi:MAG: serine/threonine-protein kinase [Chthoniobacterales bacterium]
MADALQQSCPKCGTIVDVSAIEPLARVECPSCGEKFRVARAFDNFELVETLGVGGMGSVYKARDTRLERFVALKLLRKELSADPAEAARLEQEARLTAAVNHPNVVQVYSSGTDHGQIYLVMELVDHGSLDDLMAQQTKLPEQQVLEAGIQVAKGLEAAHERGLIHRDVKPANILFSQKQTAKIGDFGLAVAAEHNAEAQREIWGTPYYVAPERLDNAPEDFRSDIYSLGATLFHAIAGKPPMEGETTSASELRKLKAKPPGLRSVAPKVSRETARAIDKMIAPEPASRYASYAELIHDLQRADDGLAPRQKRSPVRIVVIALVALLALGEAGLYLFSKRKAAAASKTPTPAATPDNLPALQKRYEDARADLINAKYEPAATAFAKIVSEAQNRQPLANWARLHQGLALLLDGKASPARDVFRSLETAAPSPNAKPEGDLAPFFVETGKALAAPGPIRGGELDSKGVNFFRLFLYGAKDWQLREFDEAAGLLQLFMQADVPNELKWIADYKPVAKKHLDDHALYGEAKALPQRITKTAEATAALDKVHALQKRVQTRGALWFYLKDEEKSLNTTVTTLQNTEREAREHAAGEDFERSKPVLLAKWKSTLAKDLATGAYKAPITMGATTHEGVQTANEREITLRIAPYGGAAIPWDKFPPATLLQLSRAFIRPGAPDAAERQWLAAVYAESTAQTDAARQLADEAAKAKPEYREQMKLLLRD